MTSTIQFPALVIGLMSGTSADGVDAAVLKTNGRSKAVAGETLFLGYSDGLRKQILALMQGEGDEAAVAQALTEVHCEAVEQLLEKAYLTPADVALIGFHGQTIKHDPAKGITVQLGNADYMAKRLGIPVVADFRTADVQAGGQGAPLVPLYHAALAKDLPKPLMVVNIGGVANVTWIGPDESILAFDCGPGNALIDDWVHRHTGERYDKNGEHAARGKVDARALYAFIENPFFKLPAPKSLDRNQFHEVMASIEHLSPNDGTATLTAMTAVGIAQACKLAPIMPKELLICGGGRHNLSLMGMIKHYVSSAKVLPVESVGWNGDMLEAQAFAYLAARSYLKLPLSLPTTTGVKEPVTGGVFHPVPYDSAIV